MPLNKKRLLAEVQCLHTELRILTKQIRRPGRLQDRDDCAQGEILRTAAWVAGHAGNIQTDIEEMTR